MKIIKLLMTVFVGLFIATVPAFAQLATQVPLSPKVVPQFVDPLPHFAGHRVYSYDGTTELPLTIRMQSTDQQALSSGTILPNGTVVGGELGLTHVWGYQVSNGRVTRGPLWPTWTIEAKRGVALNVTYSNELNESYDAVNLWVDQTLHWALGTHSGEPYLDAVPLVAHLHGGEVPAWSDGGPDAWFLPGGAATGHAFMTNVYYYPNTQEAATLWFHDHALGVTRLNVYAGLAGFYFLRDDKEDALHLPGWSGDDLVMEAAGGFNTAGYLPEIEVAIQDRMFDTNGQLYLPNLPPNPAVHPYWTPEFVGDIITVNGKTWPYLSVAPRTYRFRLLNGSNARFYELWLQDLVAGTMGPVIYQIGTDGGLLDAPVAIDPNLGGKLLLAPGERADVVIDFSGSAANQVWTLKNSGNTPYPKGAPPTGATLGRIMQFVVNGTMVTAAGNPGTDKSDPLPVSLRSGQPKPEPLVKLANFTSGTTAAAYQKERQLTLNEVMGPGGPLEVLVNNTKWSGHSSRTYNDFTEDPSGQSTTMYSEIVKEGETEVWKIINITADAHPIHLHLVQFQLVSRQKFNLNKYLKAYNQAFPGGTSPVDNLTYPPKTFIPGWGPPQDYNAFPAGAAALPVIGGNPDITPYLQGMIKPANPNERGWKDTFIMYPGEVTTVIVRWAPTDKPVSASPASLYFDAFNPDGGHGYVWHCHIIDHEDNEMMRPYSVVANQNAPVRIAAPATPGYVMPAAVNPAGQIVSAGKVANDMMGEELTSTLPTHFSLSQNFPNPFNPVTSIRFTLPEDSYVRLKVYNTLGQEVATLIDGNAPAGFHTVQLEAGNLASGVYLYQITAGGFSDIKKMMLIK